ncbi:MAG: 30S ribosomal protein S4 [Simkaniaceae bacterium]|nr:30S ribosomal protein S4 [Simkaniaceae bacterium]
MARYTGPKNRIARRFGANIFGRLRNPLLHKPNPPGMHGALRKKKSDYGAQLEEKQKLRAIYGMIPQKKLLKYYKEAVRRKENTHHLLLEFLECRLDNIVYKLRLAQTIFHAQQLVSHGHIYVDGKRTSIRSFQVQPGMVISLKPKSHQNPIVVRALENKSRDLPEYLEFDEKKMEGKLIVKPAFDQISLPLPINVPLVCEFLAHTN